MKRTPINIGGVSLAQIRLRHVIRKRCPRRMPDKKIFCPTWEEKRYQPDLPCKLDTGSFVAVSAYEAVMDARKPRKYDPWLRLAP